MDSADGSPSLKRTSSTARRSLMRDIVDAEAALFEQKRGHGPRRGSLRSSSVVV
jgi:hypothetical protein